MSAVMEVREPSAKYFSALKPPLVQHFDLMASAPGGVTNLRELILTLAVQGKLVPQDPKDEPASELLKRIRAEKDRLIAEGKTKRGKPLAELENRDEPFLLPERWCWVRLGEITNYGSPVKAGTLLPNTWVLDMEDIEKSSGRLVQRLRFAERPAVSDKNCFSKGDVLYGKLRPYLNKVLVADENGVCTTEIIPFRCFGEYEPGYFRLALSSPYFLEYVNARSYGMKMPRLGTDDARNSVFPLPPLAEQSRIVTRVEELMRLCDALEAKSQIEMAQHAQLVQTLLGAMTASTSPEELVDNWQRVSAHFDLLLDRPEAINALEQTILQLAVRGLLVNQVPSKHQGSQRKNLQYGVDTEQFEALELPFEVPLSWRWTRLGSVAELINGDRGPNYPNKSEYITNGIPFINTGHIEPDGTLSHGTMNFLTRAKFESLRSGKTTPGDLVYCLRGATLGKTAIVDYPEGAIASSLVIIRPNEDLDRRYAYLYLTSPLGQTLVRRFDNGSAQPNLAAGSVRKYVVPLPPLEEQQRIVARVESLRSLCEGLRQRLAARQTAQAELAEALIDEVA